MPSCSADVPRFAAVVALVIAGLTSLVASAGPIRMPTGLNPGDQYRLVFVTEGTDRATSSNISTYDVAVQLVADSHAELAGLTWQVIGSTTAVSARDHTGTAPANGPGVPIYLLNDTRLADNYADLWDGSILTPLNVTDGGTHVIVPVGSFSDVWTGTAADGSQLTGAELGNTNTHGSPVAGSAIGTTQQSNNTWIFLSTESHEIGNCTPICPRTNHLYALSSVLSVPGSAVPEASTHALLILGLAALLVVRRHRFL
jgi:hypothetical protein